MQQKPRVIAIVGATSTGKSAFAVELAKRLKGEIISVDSRQVYRGLNLGSGKVTKREMAGIPHHLLDIASPKQTVSASQFTQKAQKVIADITMRNRVPILVGGTGFYLDAALCRFIAPEVPPNKKLRARLEKKNAKQLFAMLTKLDPRRAKEIDPHNPVRLIRAIEIALVLGAVPKKQSAEKYDVQIFGLTLPNDVLQERIEARLKARLRSGMLKEAVRLHQGGLSYTRMEELGLEYRYMARHLRGDISKKEMELQLLREIVRYAKRQKTWFTRDKTIIWLSPTHIAKALHLAKRHLKK